MLTLKNNSDSIIVVLHEIYGINNHIKKVCEDFYRSGFDVACPDLLNLDRTFSYEKENEAYQYFMNHIGFDSASKLVTDLLIQVRDRYKRVILLGYSVGATTGWLCSENGTNCDGFVGFYGSRIREYINVIPKCPVLLFFPQEEKSFNTKELKHKLIERDNVEVHILEGGHGFAEPFSNNYNESSYNVAKRIVKGFLTGSLPTTES